MKNINWKKAKELIYNACEKGLKRDSKEWPETCLIEIQMICSIDDALPGIDMRVVWSNDEDVVMYGDGSNYLLIPEWLGDEWVEEALKIESWIEDEREFLKDTPYEVIIGGESESVAKFIIESHQVFHKLQKAPFFSNLNLSADVKLYMLLEKIPEEIDDAFCTVLEEETIKIMKREMKELGGKVDLEMIKAEKVRDKWGTVPTLPENLPTDAIWRPDNQVWEWSKKDENSMRTFRKQWSEKGVMKLVEAFLNGKLVGYKRYRPDGFFTIWNSEANE